MAQLSWVFGNKITNRYGCGIRHANSIAFNYCIWVDNNDTEKQNLFITFDLILMQK